MSKRSRFCAIRRTSRFETLTNTEMDLYGFGTGLAAGKEWWVSSNWGLGATTVVRFASMKLRDYDAKLTATSISLLLSATFN